MPQGNDQVARRDRADRHERPHVHQQPAVPSATTTRRPGVRPRVHARRALHAHRRRSGRDPVWFGAIMLLNVEFATISPPFGLSLFVMEGIASPDTTMGDLYRTPCPSQA
jgi:hypothetical protein